MISRSTIATIPGARALYRGIRRFVNIQLASNTYARQAVITLSWPHTTVDQSSKNNAAIKRAAASPDAIKLNVGGGKGHPKVAGWTVIDLRESSADLVLNIAEEKLPFPDQSVDVIFSSHTLEHIYPQQLGHVLQEFHRVLKPETGLLRLILPDISKAIAAYQRGDYTFFQKSDLAHYDADAPLGGLMASWFYSTRLFSEGGLNHGDGHVHCFDVPYLTYWLNKAGFDQVWETPFQMSVLPEMRSDAFDRHPDDSFFLEALRTR